jgi:predicted ATP-dependent serine protease
MSVKCLYCNSYQQDELCEFHSCECGIEVPNGNGICKSCKKQESKVDIYTLSNDIYKLKQELSNYKKFADDVYHYCGLTNSNKEFHKYIVTNTLHNEVLTAILSGFLFESFDKSPKCFSNLKN